MSYINQIVEDGVTYDIAAKNLENDFTQTTAGVNALDAAAGKSLNDALTTLDGAVVKKANLVNGFAQTTAGQNALDAVAGKTLYDKVSGFCSFSFNIPTSGSIALNVSNSARFMVFGTAPNSGVMFACLCATNGSGSSTTVHDLHLGSNITHTSAQSKLTFANSNSTHSPKCLCIMLSDTPTVSV